MESPLKESQTPAAPSARLGAQYLGSGRCRFEIWAPKCEQVDLLLIYPYEKTVPLLHRAGGFFHAIVENVKPGARYLFRLDGGDKIPDPASRFQPEGCTGPSEVSDASFQWSDGFWCGRPLQELIFYELHIGTFTPEGTFDAAIERLDDIQALGITAVEIMPVAQFPGGRNWGYDGIFPYAVQNTYGGPAALKRFADACHKRRLVVVLDVVYNHIGPEGHGLDRTAPFFTDKYQSPWGPVFNFDGPGSDGVRRFFVDNAVYWIEEFHVDALRLDAVSAIFDAAPVTFLEDLAQAVHAYGQKTNRLVYAIAETAHNDSRFVRQPELGGYGLDAQWSFDFHHALHALLTGEDCGYYEDYGGLETLARAYRDGFAYTGQYSPYWGRRHGSPSAMLPGRKFVVYAQNHDETGNRPTGDRYGTLLSLEEQKLAAGLVLLSPFLPLLFMGEEYGETAPFFFFVEPGDAGIAEATRAGRIREAAAFGWKDTPADPIDVEAFTRSKLRWKLRLRGRHKALLSFYTALISLRKENPALKDCAKDRITVKVLGHVLYLQRGPGLFAAFQFGNAAEEAVLTVPEGKWRRLLDSSDAAWDGPGALGQEDLGSADSVRLTLHPKSFVVYERQA